MSLRLYIPGPVQVAPEIYEAMTTPVIGHRSPAFVELYQSVQPGLQALFQTQDPVFISTSSAWGVMEGAVRNVTRKGVLNCMCGAFSDKWNDVSERAGFSAGALPFEWGEPVDPDAVRRELQTGKYDAITLVHNETSVGLMNPLPELMAVIREFPDVISIVDTVSSFSALPIPKDELGIDIMLTGSQKALALPPGLALFSVSQRALDRAAEVEGRGYYFDLHEFLKNHEKGMTPSTPIIPLIFALRKQVERIQAEGLEKRYARHSELNGLVHRWADKHGFGLFPRAGYASKTLSCLRNDQDVDLKGLNKALGERYGFVIDTGYGKIKGKTFRISNMGEETAESLQKLLDALDTLLPEFTGATAASTAS